MTIPNINWLQRRVQDLEAIAPPAEPEATPEHVERIVSNALVRLRRRAPVTRNAWPVERTRRLDPASAARYLTALLREVSTVELPPLSSDPDAVARYGVERHRVDRDRRIVGVVLDAARRAQSDVADLG